MAEDAGSAPAEVLLAEGTRFEGLLVMTRPARIDGELRGEVQAGGLVWVGEAGVVAADLEADAVVVEGKVEGDLRGRRSIALGPRAVVHGDLRAPQLAIAEGAQVEGRCACGELEPPARPDPDGSPAHP